MNEDRPVVIAAAATPEGAALYGSVPAMARSRIADLLGGANRGRAATFSSPTDIEWKETA